MNKRQWSTMMLALLMALVIVLAPGMQSARAGVAAPGVFTLTDPNTGVSVQAESHGDHQFNFTADTEGRILLMGADGSWYYVRKAAGGYAQGPAISNPAPQDASLVRMGDEGLREKLTALQLSFSARESGATNGAKSAQYVDGVPDSYDFPASDPLHGYVGAVDLSQIHAPEKASTCPLAVLVVDFADISSSFTPAQWHTRIFDDGIQNYYTTVSNGRFTYVPVDETHGDVNDGVVNVTLPINAPLYTKASASNQVYYNDINIGLYYTNPAKTGPCYAIFGSGSIFAYAVRAAEGFIDFDRYDRNGDGMISPTELALMVVFCGYEVSSFYPTDLAFGKPGMWAHSGYFGTWRKNEARSGYVGYNAAVQVDHKWVYKYTMMAENTNMHHDYEHPSPSQPAMQAQFGTACHELGHDLGLADLYNTDLTKTLRKNVGYLSVMANGVDGIGSAGGYGSSPTHFDPHCKIKLGFYEPTVVAESGTYPLYAAEPSRSYNILRVNTNDPSIYYLLENRICVGFDKGLQDGYTFANPGGVVIWRVDDRRVNAHYADNKLNTEEGEYGVMPVFVDAAATNPFWGGRSRSMGGSAYSIPELPGGVIYCEADSGPVTFVRLKLPPRAPQTGDAAQPWLWSLMAVAAMAVAAAVLVSRRRRTRA